MSRQLSPKPQLSGHLWTARYTRVVTYGTALPASADKPRLSLPTSPPAREPGFSTPQAVQVARCCTYKHDIYFLLQQLGWAQKPQLASLYLNSTCLFLMTENIMYPEEVFFNLNTSGSKTRFWNKVFIIPMLKPAGPSCRKIWIDLLNKAKRVNFVGIKVAFEQVNWSSWETLYGWVTLL